MSAILGYFLTNPTIVAIFAGAIAVVVAFAKGRLSGAKLERQKQAASDAKAKTVADEIDDAIAGRSPDANRKELSKWAPR